MPFVLNEAIVQIKGTGFNRLQQNIDETHKKMDMLGKRAESVFKNISGTAGTNNRKFSGFQRFQRHITDTEKKMQALSKTSEMVFKSLSGAAGTTNQTFSGFKRIERHIESTQKKVKSLTKSLKELGEVAKDAFDNFPQNPLGNLPRPSQGGRPSHGRPSQGGRQFFFNAGRNFSRLGHEARNASTSIGQVLNSLSGVSTAATVAGEAFFTLGTSGVSAISGITLATTAAISAITALGATVVKAVGMSADLEKSLAEVATISSDVAGNLDEFAEILGDIAVATRTDVGLLSEGLYQTISSGITDTADALTFLETSALAARAGLTSVDVAVDGLSSVVNAFGIDAADVGGVADKFFKTVEVGKLRFEDLARSIGKVAPIATTLGVSLDELLAAGAALTTGGLTLGQSFTQVRSLLNAVLRPSAKAKQITSELGIEFNVAALRSKGLAGFLRDLNTATGGNAEIMGQLIGRVEGLQGALALTGAQAEAFDKNLQAISNSSGATDKAVSIMNETLHGSVDLLREQLNRGLRVLGSEILPIVTAEIKNISEFLQEVDWESFRAEIRETIKFLKSLISAFQQVHYASRIAFHVPSSVAQGIAAGPTARAALATGQFPSLADDLRSADDLRYRTGPQERAVATDINVLQEIALAFTKSNVLSQAAVNALRGFGGETEIVKALKEAGVSNEGLAEAIGKGYTSALRSNANSQSVETPGVARNSQKVAEAVLANTTLDVSVVAPNVPRVRTPESLTAQPRLNGRSQIARSPHPTIAPRDIQIAPLTAAPIPGVQGELIDPSTAITFSDGIDTFKEALAPLEALADTSQPPDLGIGQAFVDEMLQIEREKAAAFPEELKAALGPIYKDTPALQAPTNQIGNIVKDAGEQLASNFSLVSSAIEGAGAGGLPGALIAVGTELLQMTPAFERITEGFNGVIGKLVTAINPVVDAIADVLSPVFEALGEVVSALEPLFQVLGTVLKLTITPAAKALGVVLNGLAKVVRFVANVWIKIINGLIGLINKIPFVDIAKIPEAGVNAENAPGVDAERARRTGESEAPRGGTTRGIQVSRITGPTRDIFVDLLSPLRQLDSIFPAMLDELRLINANLTGGHNVPQAPALGGIGNAGIGGANLAGVGGIHVDNLTVQIEQIQDLDGEAIVEEVRRRLDGEGRAGGGVFPDNQNQLGNINARI